MDRFPRILRALFLGTLAGLAACSSGESKSVEKKLDFPPSLTQASAGHHTAVVPNDVVPEMVPILEESEQKVAPMLVPESLPETFSEFMQRGRSRFGDGDMSKAVADFEEAVAKRPASASANLQLARALVSMGESERAREFAETAIELDAGSSLAWNTLGRIELAERNHEAAIVSFQRAAFENEDNSYAWNNLGFAHMESGDYQAAAEALEQATSGSSPTSYMWNNLGMAYEHLDQIIEARAAYRQAVSAGSAKAQSNVDRLEGVVSLVPSAVEINADDQINETAFETVEDVEALIE